MTSLTDRAPIAIVGGGPAGTLLAVYLAQRGHEVDLYESRADLRVDHTDAGRSINLALATRGIAALQAAGIRDEVADIAIAMSARMVHTTEGCERQPYGTAPHEVIYSINRSDLNGILLTTAEKTGRVRLHFQHRLREVDLDANVLRFTTPTTGPDDRVERPFGLVFGADGANSVIRAAILQRNGGTVTEDMLDHSYKELTIPPDPAGGFLLEPDALHIWPRGDFMLIALANPEGDFTATLFLPSRPGVAGPGESFAELTTSDAVEGFFRRQFDDFVPLVPDLAAQFFENPTGDLSTIRCTGWALDDRAVILGDAAHAIVPFHGQGMNAAMESAQILTGRLDDRPDDLSEALTRFAANRKPDTDAIADMALDNYLEMRSGVINPAYLIKRELALELQRRFPSEFTPRYGLVMFTTIPYADVARRARLQADILETLTAGIDDIAAVDFERARALVAELPPLPADAGADVRLTSG